MDRKRVYGLVASIAIFAFAIGISFLNKKGHAHPFVLNVYAREADGSLVEQELEESVKLPVSLLETFDGLKGFLLSMDSGHPRPPSVSIITAGSYEHRTVELMKLLGDDLERGRAYFFFVGQSTEELENITLFHSDAETGWACEMVVRIRETQKAYFAELKKLTCFPVQVQEEVR